MFGQASPPQTLQDLVSALEQKGTAALNERFGRPALILCDRSDGKNETWGFETRAVSAPWDMRVALALARSGRVTNPELLSKAGAVFSITKRPGGPFPDRIGVGRARTADISIRHSSVSKYHAYFTQNEARSAWMLWDAGSRNGTTVGEHRLGSGEGVAMENGATVMLGESLFLFFTEAGFRTLVETLVQSTPGALRSRRG